MSGAYGGALPVALERGLVTVAQIDAAVRRVLRLKARLGLFEDPYHRSDAALAPPGQAEKHRELAREAARRSIVLLTNRDGVLPLQDAMRRLAVIGPLADARDDMLGPWAAAGRAEGTVTILEGLRAALPERDLTHAAGVSVDGAETGGIGAALDLARAADLVVLCLGEARRMSGEAASRARPDLPGHQAELAQAVLDLGKPVVVLLSSGRPLMAPWLFERAHAVLATWFLGSEAGHAVGDVVSGRHNPAGRLPVSWPVEVGQIPIYYARRPSGRPAHPEVHYSSKYLDLPVEPLFPFGHGLSYSRFVPAELRLSAAELRPGQELAVEVNVTNQGPRPGEATMFLFIRDPVAAVSRPLLELRGIAKAALEPGASTTLSFALTADDLRFLDPDLSPRLEPGLIEVFVGPSANPADLLRAEFRLVLEA
jgi:beta-glucosidase